MPTAPKRPCTHPGCAQLVGKGACVVHQRAREQTRGSAAVREYGRRHQRWRLMVLARDPVCVDPDKRHVGRVVPSTVADHVVPLARGGGWDMENAQGLCASCHGFKTRRENA